jgi:SNF2 family DNA or RNA helicase
MMEVVDNRGLLLRVRNPEKITAAIPKSKNVGNNQVLVRWGIDESRVLRNLNVRNVPSPILGQYDWTGRYPPFEHQKTTASFLTMHKRAFCFNEQGTGKTGAAIWASDFLMREGAVKRVLIISPVSIMYSAWHADLFNFAMHRSVSVAHGSRVKRQKILAENSDYVVINYDGVEIVQEEIKNGGFDLIIVDEATHYKNAQSRRWKVLNNLLTPDTWLWMMTGTPAAQSPLDAYGLAKLINPKQVPRFFGAFREMLMYKVTKFKWVPKDTAIDTVFNALQPAIRFTKKQCLDLPEMTYTKREVELTPQQRKYYETLRKEMLAVADGEMISAANAAVNMNKLLQIACGAVYTDSGETIEFDIKNRYKVLREVIDESSQKVLIFVPFKHVIDILSEKLTKDGITSAIIRGDVNVNKRTEIFKQFQTQDDPRVLIIQPQAAAHGVTLTAANTIVWWGPVSSLETYAQANARVHRSGQKHPCTVVQLEGAPVEAGVYRMLDQRIDAHTKVIDLYKEIIEM